MSVPRFVAFLRGINVGGHTVAMEELRDLLTEAGLEDVRTFIASGNVVFNSRARDLAGLEERLERRLHAALGFPVATFVRSAAAVAAIAASPAFPAARRPKAVGTYVGFLKTAPGPTAARAMLALGSSNDQVELRGREVYWLSRTGMRGSGLSYSAFERAAAGPVTFRGLNTINRLVAKYGLDGAR